MRTLATGTGLVLGAALLGVALAHRLPAAADAPAGSPAAKALPGLAAARAVDLTHAIDEKTPHWPGAKYHPFRRETIATLEHDCVFSETFCLPAHLGTHLDAPNHFVAGRRPVDEIPVEQLAGEAVVIDISARVAKDPDAMLTPADLAAFAKAHGAIPKEAVVLVRTGFAARAGDPAAYANKDDKGRMHFPGVSLEAATLLAERPVRGVGIDTLSIDRGLSTGFEAHKALNSAQVYALENLNERLAELPPRGALVVALPMKVRGGSGGPCRVVAWLQR